MNLHLQDFFRMDIIPCLIYHIGEIIASYNKDKESYDMKKYLAFAFALSICGTLLMGCGCSNSAANTTTPTTIMPPTRETAAPTTVPTTMPTTAPATEATNPTDMYGDTSETAGENGIVEDTPSTQSGESGGESGGGSIGGNSGESTEGRSRNRTPMNPMG